MPERGQEGGGGRRRDRFTVQLLFRLPLDDFYFRTWLNVNTRRAFLFSLQVLLLCHLKAVDLFLYVRFFLTLALPCTLIVPYQVVTSNKGSVRVARFNLCPVDPKDSTINALPLDTSVCTVYLHFSTRSMEAAKPSFCLYDRSRPLPGACRSGFLVPRNLSSFGVSPVLFSAQSAMLSTIGGCVGSSASVTVSLYQPGHGACRWFSVVRGRRCWDALVECLRYRRQHLP